MFLYIVILGISTRAISQTVQMNSSTGIAKSQIDCSFFKYGTDLDVKELVGSWMTVYSQPKSVSCFSINIRATTDLEREQHMLKYGNFLGRVDWSKCFLEVETKVGKHFFQGDGSHSGILENIIIVEEEHGYYELQEQSADQWTIFGRRGSELLLMRDCAGEAVAIFARAPYWPAPEDLYSILHRSGIAPLTKEKVLCEPQHLISRNCNENNDFYDES